MQKYWHDYFVKNGKSLGIGLLVAVLFWIVILVIMPQMFMVDFSFRANVVDARQWGTDAHYYTLENYKYMLYGSANASGTYNTVDLSVFGRTILAAVFVTLIDLALCYPVAYYLAHVAKGGWARLMVLALIIPFWVNELLRAFSFKIMFGSTGVINNFLVWAGILEQPYDFIFEGVALYAGLSYAYILLMIFPIYNAIESLDKNQIEAARDMGASTWKIHRRVVIPHAKPGISSGATMVFMLSLGALAAPQILGGPSSLWFTQIIYQAFNNAGNWARGSAYAIVLLVTSIIFVLIVMKVFKVKFGDIAR
jgi:spermidine/putrescine transport system permease protein